MWPGRSHLRYTVTGISVQREKAELSRAVKCKQDAEVELALLHGRNKAVRIMRVGHPEYAHSTRTQNFFDFDLLFRAYLTGTPEKNVKKF